MKPLVSIIIPTYNRAHLIKETIDSVLAQTYMNWECIIIDDRSNDATKAILDEYSTIDNRFIIICKPIELKQGASVSRNFGLKLARGEYIQFLDSDDILADNKIEEQVKILLNESNFTISTCKWGRFNEIKEPISFYENKRDYINFSNAKDYFDLIGLYGSFFPPLNFLMSKELINFSGYWNESLSMNDDGEFFFRLILNSDKIIFSEKTYVLYRDSSINNLSLLNAENKAISLINSWKIVEALYLTKYDESDSSYINKKKESVYNELKRDYKYVINRNKDFFKKQIEKDTLFLKFKKIKKRIINKLISYFK